jgi:hypothetical protein
MESDLHRNLHKPRYETVALIACSRKKGPALAPAWRLYQGSRFLLACRKAGLFASAAFVLSAKHGLVCMGQELEPYDESLADKTPAQRSEWGQRVMAQFAGFMKNGDGSMVLPRRIVVFAEALYAEPIRPYLPCAEFPLASLDEAGQKEYLARAA